MGTHEFLPPMLATLGAEAFDSEEFWFEPKWDGMRVLLVLAEGEVRLYSRNGNDVTIGFPEFKTSVESHGTDFQGVTILDGEIILMGPDGLPDFELLSNRFGVSSGSVALRLAADSPCNLVLFDCLVSGGADITTRPLTDRRVTLENIHRTHFRDDPRVVLSEITRGTGRALFAAVSQLGMEGVVAKRTASRYQPGVRSQDWVKIKVVREDDFIVIGWTEGKGARSGGLGALILGSWDDNDIRCVGSVGTGFDQVKMRSLLSTLSDIAVEEPDQAIICESIAEYDPDPVSHWVEPKIVVTVAFSQFTRGARLRHPSYKTVRIDKNPRDCRLDPTFMGKNPDK